MSRAPSEALRDYLRAHKITAYRVAKAAGMSRPDPIQRWLSGERGLRLATFDRICAALGWSLQPPPERPQRVERRRKD